AVALLAESNSERSALRFRPHPSLTHTDASEFALPLRNPRYAVAFDSEGPRAALMADFDSARWMRGDGYSLLLGNGPGAQPFELVTNGETVESMTCSPALIGFHAPLEGAIVEPAVMEPGAAIAFETESAQLTQLA